MTVDQAPHNPVCAAAPNRDRPCDTGNPALDRPVVDADGPADIANVIATAQQPQCMQTCAAMPIAFMLILAIQIVLGFVPLDDQWATTHDLALRFPQAGSRIRLLHAYVRPGERKPERI